MNKLDEITRKRKQAHQKLLALKSNVYQSFLQMEQATYADGALPRKTKELIAIGISVLTDCESCMQWHIDQAAACGATRQEILEAIEVGIEMGAGRVTVSARFALEVMERAFSPNRARPRTADEPHGGRLWVM
jgi:AhpD family alkylhydroperoxidase